MATRDFPCGKTAAGKKRVEAGIFWLFAVVFCFLRKAFRLAIFIRRRRGKPNGIFRAAGSRHAEIGKIK